MERLKEVLKDLQSKARELRDETYTANFVIAELQNDVEDEGQLTPKNEREFEAVSSDVYDLYCALNNFLVSSTIII